MPAPHPVIAWIFDIFAREGHAHYGEHISQLQHALQCAQLAREHGCTDSLIAAALLHDLGRMIEPEGNDQELRGIDARHEDSGARALAPAFAPAVTEPIRLHVAAKRYLAATDPDYVARLSEASLLSLKVQGGPMRPDEITAFEADPFFADALQLRRFDDWGKRIGCPVAELGAYRELLESLCQPHPPHPLSR